MTRKYNKNIGVDLKIHPDIFLGGEDLL